MDLDGHLNEVLAQHNAASSDVVYRLRYDSMTYEFISENIAKLLGFTGEELSRIGLRNLILETRLVTDGMRKVDDYSEMEAARRDGKLLKWQADYHVTTKDGNVLWLSDVSHPWYDESGAIIGSIGMLRDITERVRAEEEGGAFDHALIMRDGTISGRDVRVH